MGMGGNGSSNCIPAHLYSSVLNGRFLTRLLTSGEEIVELVSLKEDTLSTACELAMLILSILPANYSQDISQLKSCLNSLRIWFCENGMAHNPTKSVAILFGTPKRLKSFSGLKSCNVAGTDIQLCDKVKILGPR